jgi:hypothetical protein
MQRCRYCQTEYAAVESRLRCETLHVLRKTLDRTRDQPAPTQHGKQLHRPPSVHKIRGKLTVLPKKQPKNTSLSAISGKFLPSDDDSASSSAFAFPWAGVTSMKTSKRKSSRHSEDVKDGGSSDSEEENDHVNYNELDGGDGSEEDAYACSYTHLLPSFLSISSLKRTRFLCAYPFLLVTQKMRMMMYSMRRDGFG